MGTAHDTVVKTTAGAAAMGAVTTGTTTANEAAMRAQAASDCMVKGKAASEAEADFCAPAPFEGPAELFLSDIHGEYEQASHIVNSVRACPGGLSALHFVGDVYDRGPAPDAVMDMLAAEPCADIQWGNHDIVWMGAAAGQPGCIAHVVRICARYGNLSVLEDIYGIDLSALSKFAASAYADDPCAAFGLKGSPALSDAEQTRHVKIQKAMAIIQFKVESALIARNPSFGLQDRDLLGRVDFAHGTVQIDGQIHELLDPVFPTVDASDPCRLSAAEQEVLDALVAAFTSCEKLQRHIRVFLDRGSLYKICGDLLLFHACVPLRADGHLQDVELFGTRYRGRALFDAVDAQVRAAFTASNPEKRRRGLDMLWYLWLGPGSPLFAKSKMATFELYYVADKAARKEEKNPFYTLCDDAEVLARVFEDFGMDASRSHIVCGHVPVKVKSGENPIRCGGRFICIDGGMSKPYRSKTGVAGLSLVKDACGRLFLAAHGMGTAADEGAGELSGGLWEKLRELPPLNS